MLKKRYWLLITLLLITVLSVRAFPATWVFYFVQQAAPGLQVSGVSGSLWRGQADISQWVNRGHTLPLGQLQWQLRGLSVLTLNPCLTFSALAQNQSIKGEACYGLFSGAAEAKELDFNIPAERIGPFYSVNLQGVFEGYIPQLQWQGQGLGEADGSVLWQQAAFHSGYQWVALGDIQATGEDDGTGGLLSQINSVNDNTNTPPVTINIEAAVSQLTAPQPRLRVNGTMFPDAQANGLRQILQLVGEPITGGGYRIEINE